jgi:hypothetical protein
MAKSRVLEHLYQISVWAHRGVGKPNFVKAVALRIAKLEITLGESRPETARGYWVKSANSAHVGD